MEAQGMAALFMGEYRHSLDEKGRLIMPARLREGLGETFVVTKGLDQCLFAYPQEEWKKLQLKLQKLPFTQANARAFVRFFFSGAAECAYDKQGRISLPGHLREYARLEKDVVILGVGTRVELWDPQVWDTYAQQTAQQYAAIAEELVGLDGS